MAVIDQERARLGASSAGFLTSVCYSSLDLPSPLIKSEPSTNPKVCREALYCSHPATGGFEGHIHLLNQECTCGEEA